MRIACLSTTNSQIKTRLEELALTAAGQWWTYTCGCGSRLIVPRGDEHYQLDEFEWPLVVTSNDGNFSQNHVDVHKNSTTYDNKKIQEIEPQTSTAPLLKIVSFLPKWRHVWGFFYPFLDTCAESMAEVFRPQFIPIYSWMGNFYIIGVTTCLKRP